MAKQELRRKIIATVLTVTMLCALLGVCAWLLLSNKIFNSTIHTMMLLCTAVLGIATIGLFVAKLQEILALREVVRTQAQTQTPAPPLEPVPHTELEPVQSLDHKTIELPKLTDIPLAGQQTAAPAQPKAKGGRRGHAEPQAQPQPAVEVVPPTPVSRPEPPAEPPKWKPIDFGAALKARENQENAARQRAEEQARRALQAQLAAQQQAEEDSKASLSASCPQAAAEKPVEPEQLEPEADSLSTPCAEPVPDAPEAADSAQTQPLFDSDAAQTPAQPALEIQFDESQAALSPQAPAACPQTVDPEAFDYDRANAEHLQAIRHVQETRRSSEARLAEEEKLAQVARQAELERLGAQPQNAQPIPAQPESTLPVSEPDADAQPIDPGMWEAWQPNAVSFEDSAPAPQASPLPSADAAPARRDEALWSQTPASTVPLHNESILEPESEPEHKAVPDKKKHRGFFGAFHRRKKAAPEQAAASVSIPAPAAPAEPEPVVPVAVPDAEKADEPAPVKLNVKPIAWPAPPPPSRNFVHPPQSTMQFAAITPEQIAQLQAEAQRQKAANLNAQRQAAARQASRTVPNPPSCTQPAEAPQPQNTVSNTESYWKD